MTSTPIDSQLDSLRAKGSGLIAAYKARIADIQNDASRSDGWKREQSQEAYNTTTSELKSLLEKEEAAIDEAIAHRSRSLTGSHTPLTGNDAIAQRDADDRIADIKESDKALHLMERALHNNDVILAKALLTRSLHYGFTDAVNAYAAANPATSTTLAELESLSRHRGLNADLGRQFFYGAISPAR